LSDTPLLSPEISKAMVNGKAFIVSYVLCADTKQEPFSRIIRENVVIFFTYFVNIKPKNNFLY
jgi:hypothetical protein